MGWKMIAPGPTGPQTTFDPVQSLAPKMRKRLRWPREPEKVVRIWDLPDLPYTVDVEFVQGDEGPIVTGISIRRNFLLDSPEPELAPVSGRDVRRMPLDRIVSAALAAVSESSAASGWAGNVGRALTPRGRPKRGRSHKFYAEVAAAYRRLAQRGEVVSPVRELAKRMNVPENRVHQWVYQARQKGLLEPSSRSAQREGKEQ